MRSKWPVKFIMAGEIHRLRDKAGETEKITLNLGYVDLGHIDLLCRTAFIPTVPTSFGQRSANATASDRYLAESHPAGILPESLCHRFSKRGEARTPASAVESSHRADRAW